MEEWKINTIVESLGNINSNLSLVLQELVIDHQFDHARTVFNTMADLATIEKNLDLQKNVPKTK